MSITTASSWNRSKNRRKELSVPNGMLHTGIGRYQHHIIADKNFTGGLELLFVGKEKPMTEIQLENAQVIAPFFRLAYDSCPEAFLQGVMGRGFCDSEEAPTYGIIQTGSFCYLGGNGEGNGKKNILNLLPSLQKNTNITAVPLSESWDEQLMAHPSYRRRTRYAMNQPSLKYFNRNKLTTYISNVSYDPDYAGSNTTRKFVIKPIDEQYEKLIHKQFWCHPFTMNYGGYANFSETGFGFVMLEGHTGKLAGATCSYSSSLDSIEIEIAVNPAFRKSGLGVALASRMVLECISREKQPRWDATDLVSVKLAEKLGFQLEEEYISYVSEIKHA